MQVPKRRSEQHRRYATDDDLLTEEAVRGLKDDLRRLERARPKAVEDLTRAREMGDLSENAAYTEAKARLRGMDNRILSIKERLKRAVIIERGADKEGRARVGAVVTVEVRGRTKRYEIVGSQETDPGGGRISHLSPLGSMLLGAKAGDRLVLKTGDRETEYRVVSVE